MPCANGLHLKGKFPISIAIVTVLTLRSLRPKPLSSSIIAFLSPNVPLIPSVTNESSRFASTAARNAELFPSDEELSQRTLWTSIKVVSIWTVLGLAGMLPLYMVTTPCLASSAPSPEYGGMYSTLQDLSLLRVLQLLDSGEVHVGVSITASPVW